MGLTDRLNRPLRDLRISVTDRCNFRCGYCMPSELYGPGHAFLEHRELLTYEEIARLARVFLGLGVEKIRLTGGEPLLRRELAKLVAMLAPLPGLRDLALTTNGYLLAAQAHGLAAAGLHRVTVSLDSLDEDVFRRMNGVGASLAAVLAGIEAAAAAGLRPIKINAVVQRGVNDHTLLDLARFFKGTGHVVRFIEYMDVGGASAWRLDEVVTAREIVAAIDRELPLVPAGRAHPGEVAERWRYRDGSGEIGVIASISQPFCGDCSRARLSPDGKLFTCLFAATGFDLKALLRGGLDDDGIAAAIAGVWRRRDDRYSETRASLPVVPAKAEMSYLGG